MQMFQAKPGGLGHRGLAEPSLAVEGDLFGLPRVFNHLEYIARLGDTFKSQNLDRTRRCRLLYAAAVVVKHGPHSAEHRTGEKGISRTQASRLYQHSGHGTASAVESCFQNGSAGGPVRIGLHIPHVGNEQDHLQQQIEVLFLLGRHFHHHRFTSPVFRAQVTVGQLLLHTLGKGIRLVDLVNGDQQRNLGGLRVSDGLKCLRHDAVVSGYHQDDDIGYLGAAGAHQCEGFMARCVQKHHGTPSDLDPVGSDMLGNPAGFPLGDVRFPDGIQKRSLPVIHVAHHRDNRSARFEVFRLFGLLNYLLDLFLVGYDFDFGAAGTRNFGGQGILQSLIDGGEYSTVQQLRDYVADTHIQLLGKFLDGNTF